jgi:hypothetical protein
MFTYNFTGGTTLENGLRCGFLRQGSGQAWANRELSSSVLIVQTVSAVQSLTAVQQFKGSKVQRQKMREYGSNRLNG